MIEGKKMSDLQKDKKYIVEKVDVCVVGAGHAGCEAALACARLGLETVIFTVSVDSIEILFYSLKFLHWKYIMKILIYLPMQNFEKISLTKSSPTSSPIIFKEDYVILNTSMTKDSSLKELEDTMKEMFIHGNSALYLLPCPHRFFQQHLPYP